MSIDRLTAQGASRTYVQNSDATRAAAGKDTARAEHRGHHHHADSVTLSADARSLAAARDAVQSAPDVREQKVAAIKQRVDDGTYTVPAQVLARKLLSSDSTQAPQA